jgi:hypothetical protein
VHEVMPWFWAFLFTQVVEVPLYSAATRGRVLVAFGASALTHPIVWFVFPLLPVDYWPMVILAESFAILVEGAYLSLFRVRHAFAWAAAANLASVTLGFACRALLGWP